MLPVGDVLPVRDVTSLHFCGLLVVSCMRALGGELLVAGCQ